MAFNETHSPVVVDQESLIALKASAREVSLKATRQAVYTGAGETRSVFRTRGLDFQEVRAYQPGDDIRQIDWRITAKYGKPFTKLYTEEKERPVYIVCDMRSRMKFASRGDFKSVVAARTAMFLAAVAEQKKDKVHTVIILPDMIKTMVLNAADGGSLALIPDLASASLPTVVPPDETTLNQALNEAERSLKSGALVFVCSDFHDFNAETVLRLGRMGQRRTVALVHIYDELEQHLPVGVWTMTDGIKTVTVNARESSVRETFDSSFGKRSEEIREAVRKHGWGYLSVQTTDDYLSLLARFSRAEAS